MNIQSNKQREKKTTNKMQFKEKKYKVQNNAIV